MISIEIPVKWGYHIEEQLESIRLQTHQDYEIIMALPESNKELRDKTQQHDVKIVNSGPNLLDARFTAHRFAKGDFSLLLDETRIPALNLLEKLNNVKEKVVIINEEDIGDGFWVRMSNVDKLNTISCNEIDMSTGYVLPRYFESNILTEAFKNIKKNINNQIFESVIFEDHQLISLEAIKISGTFSIIKETLLYHYGDASLFSIFKKYHRYGKSHRALKNTNYEYLLSPKKRVRKICKGNAIQLYLFYAARGIPFLIGYYAF